MARVVEYSPPDRFVAGTVGEPGNRTFYLQAIAGARVTSVALEKTQVAALAERLDDMLAEVARRFGDAAAAGEDPVDREPLDTPVSEDFRATTLALAWDEEESLVVIEARSAEADEEDQGGEEVGDVLRVRVSAAAARAFARRAEAVVAAGRPPCPFCGLPLDPSGHVCPRANGYRRR